MHKSRVLFHCSNKRLFFFLLLRRCRKLQSTVRKKDWRLWRTQQEKRAHLRLFLFIFGRARVFGEGGQRGKAHAAGAHQTEHRKPFTCSLVGEGMYRPEGSNKKLVSCFLCQYSPSGSAGVLWVSMGAGGSVASILSSYTIIACLLYFAFTNQCCTVAWIVIPWFVCCTGFSSTFLSIHNAPRVYPWMLCFYPHSQITTRLWVVVTSDSFFFLTYILFSSFTLAFSFIVKKQ